MIVAAVRAGINHSKCLRFSGGHGRGDREKNHDFVGTWVWKGGTWSAGKKLEFLCGSFPFSQREG